MGVLIIPGEMLLARIPCSPHSSANCLHNMLSAAFAAPYAPFCRCGYTLDGDEMPTKAPRLCFKCGKPAFARSQLARHVRANISSQTWSDVFSIGAGSAAPALDTMASRPVNC